MFYNNNNKVRPMAVYNDHRTLSEKAVDHFKRCKNRYSLTLVVAGYILVSTMEYNDAVQLEQYYETQKGGEHIDFIG